MPLKPLRSSSSKPITAIRMRARGFMTYRSTTFVEGGSLDLADFHVTPPLGISISREATAPWARSWRNLPVLGELIGAWVGERQDSRLAGGGGHTGMSACVMDVSVSSHCLHRPRNTYCVYSVLETFLCRSGPVAHAISCLVHYTRLVIAR